MKTTPRSGVADTDWHQLNKARFASELAEILNRHAHEGDYEQLVIVTPLMVPGEMHCNNPQLRMILFRIYFRYSLLTGLTVAIGSR